MSINSIRNGDIGNARHNSPRITATPAPHLLYKKLQLKVHT